ncbi:hypothetical protein BG006_003042, partial [Podila minutissima]
AIWDHEFNHKTFMPLLGDWSEEDKKFLYVTRPSDFILSAFATFQIEDTERWRLAAYYLLTHDERVKPIMKAQAKFFASLKQINAGYKLNGKRIGDRNYSDKAFTAPASLAMWALQHPALGRVLKQMRDLESDKSYYGDSIQMLCLLQARNPRGYDTK